MSIGNNLTIRILEQITMILISFGVIYRLVLTGNIFSIKSEKSFEITEESASIIY